MAFFEEFEVSVGEGTVGAVLAFSSILPVFANLYPRSLIRNSNLPLFWTYLYKMAESRSYPSSVSHISTEAPCYSHKAYFEIEIDQASHEGVN